MNFYKKVPLTGKRVGKGQVKMPQSFPISLKLPFSYISVCLIAVNFCFPVFLTKLVLTLSACFPMFLTSSHFDMDDIKSINKFGN